MIAGTLHDIAAGYVIRLITQSEESVFDGIPVRLLHGREQTEFRGLRARNGRVQSLDQQKNRCAREHAPSAIAASHYAEGIGYRERSYRLSVGTAHPGGCRTDGRGDFVLEDHASRIAARLYQFRFRPRSCVARGFGDSATL